MRMEDEIKNSEHDQVTAFSLSVRHVNGDREKIQRIPVRAWRSDRHRYGNGRDSMSNPLAPGCSEITRKEICAAVENLVGFFEASAALAEDRFKFSFHLLGCDQSDDADVIQFCLALRMFGDRGDSIREIEIGGDNCLEGSLEITAGCWNSRGDVFNHLSLLRKPSASARRVIQITRRRSHAQWHLLSAISRHALASGSSSIQKSAKIVGVR